ncbi:hypothetical protein KBB68_03560 [Candidatus Babeliales bacterium]|nr:hypothetical protein [Candidatus Babeliales bacterium]
MFICLGLGAFVPGACANEIIDKVDKQINILVGQAFKINDKNHRLTAESLKVSLTSLKKNVLKLIENHKENYKELYESLNQLNLEDSDLPKVLSQLKIVVSKLPAPSQEFLKRKFPLLK